MNLDYMVYPPLVYKHEVHNYGRVWKIKETIGGNYNVYKPQGTWMAKFRDDWTAEVFVKTQMNENDVIAYN